MTSCTDTLAAALDRGARIRPAVGGFPHLAEALRQAGVTHCHYVVASNAPTYVLGAVAVAVQSTPLIDGMAQVAPFDAPALVAALRADQAGETTFPEFLRASWEAGVVAYDIDLGARTCTYRGALGERYVETYDAVEL